MPEPSPPSQNLEQLAKNSLVNLIGLAIPILVGLLAIPIIVKGLGVERFGLLTLAWAVIGYFSLFDLGIGRAITQALAERLTYASTRELSALAWTGLMLMLVFSLVGTCALICFTPWLVSDVLKVPEALTDETRRAFLYLAASIPAVVLSSGLSGILTALHRFPLINALRTPMGIMTFLIPLGILPYSKNLAHICAALTLMRLIFLVLHGIACYKAFPAMYQNITFLKKEILKLLQFGSWLTLSNIIGPLMVYLDRFVIGSILGIALVAYYVTPYEIVTRLWAIPAAVVAVLFPAFAAAKPQANTSTASLYASGTRAIVRILAPIALLFITFAREGLFFWIGDDFARNGTIILQWLAAGVYINGYAHVPFAYIQGIGRSDLTAKLHLIELPLYLALLIWALETFGIWGAACAWSARIALDACLLTWITHRQNPAITEISRKKIGPLIFVHISLFVIGANLQETNGKIIFFMVAFAGLTSHAICTMTPEEKSSLREFRAKFLQNKNE